jgi:hypothetical protein
MDGNVIVRKPGNGQLYAEKQYQDGDAHLGQPGNPRAITGENLHQETSGKPTKAAACLEAAAFVVNAM